MVEQIQEIIFFAIFAIAATVWGISLRMASRIGQTQSRSDSNTDDEAWQEPLANPFESISEDPAEPIWDLLGSETVECPTTQDAIQRLAKKVADGMGHPQLANHYRVDHPSPDQLLVSSDEPPSLSRGTMVAFNRAEFDARPAGAGRVEVHYRISHHLLAQKCRRISLWIILGLGLPVLLVGFSVLWFLVVGHPNQVVRWQIFQGLQVAHVLWPPFLFIGQYRGTLRRSRNAIPNMIRSIVYESS